MPVTPPGIIGVLVPNLTAVAFTGTDVSKYSNAISQGIVRWIPTIRVTTTDTGSAGVGTNVPLPLTVPQPVLYANLITGMTSHGFNGVFLPAFVLGLSNGLSSAFFQMLIKTKHPSVGTGAGVARFKAPPAATSMLSGFKAAGLKGPLTAKAALALATGLDRTFASLLIPVSIVGSASPSASAGVGFGNIA